MFDCTTKTVFGVYEFYLIRNHFATSSIVDSHRCIVIQLIVMKKETATNEKPLIDLKTFVENVNKKDKKRNGLKIRFAFTNRKRKG